MAGWYYNGIRIYATDLDGEDVQIVSKHNPLGGGTVHHVFGYADPILTLNCVVVGNTDMLALQGLATTGLSYTLSAWEGYAGEYLLDAVKYTRRPVWKQTIRPDLGDSAPVYNVTLALNKIV
jgi:hypothetical protein